MISDASTAPRPNVLALAASMLLCAGVSGAGAYGLAGIAGWGAGSGELARAAALGAASCLIPSFVASALLVAALRTGTTPAFVLMGASVARFLLSLLVGLGAFLLLHPEGKTFWASFLICGLLGIVVEAAWSVRLLHTSTSPAPGGNGVS